MRRLVLSLVVALVVTTSTVNIALAQSQPEFRLGFKTLAELIPEIVGQPLENEHFSPHNGDALQRTTQGVLVWRKSDNFTAFTDGATTWINGPLGLQSRPNDARFEWERPASPASLPAGAITFSFSRSREDSWIGQGTVQNPLNEAVDLEINVVGFSPSDGLPLADAPSVFVNNLSPGASRPIRVRIPSAANQVSWRWEVSSRPSAARAAFTQDVGTTGNLDIDPRLVGTIDVLRTVEGGDWLARVAAEHNLRIRLEPTASGILGMFFPGKNLVILSSELVEYSARVRAAVLAHELQHAVDAAAGKLPETPSQCFDFEKEGFIRQAHVWAGLWRNKLPPNVDPLHAELNEVTDALARNPEAFTAELVRRYRSECGPLP